MYGLISNIIAVDGKRDELIAILVEGSQNMPGCRSYVVARDIASPDTIWVTEVWANRESHQKSLTLPAIKQAISKGRAMIAGFGERIETEPSDQ